MFFSINGKYIAHFENGDRVDKYEGGHGFYDYHNKDGFLVEGGLLYESIFDKNYLVTNKVFNYLTSLYEQPELSLDKTNDINNPLYDQRNLLVSEMVEPENKKGILDSHKYDDADFDF